jgi:Rrf2 family protein
MAMTAMFTASIPIDCSLPPPYDRAPDDRHFTPGEECFLRLSKQTEYGLRAVVQLAKMGPRTYVQSRDLAQDEGLPGKFLEAILLTLRRGGFLDSKVGREGGYRLARPAREIMVGDVVRSLEGRLSLREGRVPADMSAGEVAVGYLNQKLTEATDDVLDKLTLEQLIEQTAKTANQQQQMYYI